MPSEGRTIVVGDVHGCAGEFKDLLTKASWSPDDHVVLVGDLFARGPDPEGVLDLIGMGEGMSFVMGNHDVPLLHRLEFLAGERAEAPLLTPGQLLCLDKMRTRLDELKHLLSDAPYVLRGTMPDQSREWWVVHGGVHPRKGLKGMSPEELISMRQVFEMKGRPFWWDVYKGPALVLFGHTPRAKVIQKRYKKDVVALGLDTGCVYGGSLTAYCLDEDKFYRVAARKAYYRK